MYWIKTNIEVDYVDYREQQSSFLGEIGRYLYALVLTGCICLAVVEALKSVLFISQENADLVTFTEEILNGKLHFLCSELYSRILEVEFCTNYLRLINICGSCTGDNCQGASCPRWELSGGNFPVGNYLGANCSRE